MDDEFTPAPLTHVSPPEPRPLTTEVRRFWLEHGEAKIGLEPRTYLLGRSSTCELIVADSRVSRRHARLVVRASNVTIEDLQSANGVFVNGERIAKKRSMSDGDQFQVASAAFVLKSEPLPARVSASETPATSPSAGRLGELSPKLTIDEDAPTMEAHSLDLLGTLAEKCLALGRAEEAEHMLQNALEELKKRALAGRGSEIPERIFAKAAHYAVLIADATERVSWVDYAIRLFAALERPLPATVVDQLYVTVRKLPGVNRSLLRDYVETLRECPDASPADRFVIQRLSGLERQISLK